MAWANQCSLDTANCEILPTDVYKTYFIKVRNGFPTLEINPIIIDQYSLEYHWNTLLYRNWERKELRPFENNFIDFENQGCLSTNYAATNDGISHLSLMYLRLPDAQIVRLTSGSNSIIVSTGRSSHIEYFNLSDSWIDVGLYSPLDFFEDEWRVYGDNPDPWNAPEHIKSGHSEWPPFQYSIKTCNHVTGIAPGQQKNGINIINEDDVYRTTVPTEISTWAVQGPWSGRIYNILSNNIYAHDILSLQFKNLRIQKLLFGGYQIFLSFGEGRIEGFDSNDRIQIADNTDQWNPNPYYITFELINNEILNYSSESGNLPDFVDDTIIYDSVLNIDLIGSRLFAGKSLTETLSPSGQIQYDIILAEQSADFINQGYTPSVVERMPLLKKIESE